MLKQHNYIKYKGSSSIYQSIELFNSVPDALYTDSLPALLWCRTVMCRYNSTQSHYCTRNQRTSNPYTERDTQTAQHCEIVT